MSQAVSERVRHLESSEAASFLIGVSSSRHLEPFLRGACSLAEAAKALGIGKTRMNYWLNKLLDLGLIEQVRIEKRGKHLVPIYQATAEVFTVPFERIPAESNEDVLRLHTKGFADAERKAILLKAQQQADRWYLEYRLRDHQGERNFRPKADASEQPLFVHAFGSISLTAEVAEAAKRELRDFIDRYAALSNPRGKAHLFKFLLVEEAPG